MNEALRHVYERDVFLQTLSAEFTLEYGGEYPTEDELLGMDGDDFYSALLGMSSQQNNNSAYDAIVYFRAREESEED